MKDHSEKKSNNLKKVEDRLRESEANLKAAQAMTHLGHWKLDAETLEVT